LPDAHDLPVTWRPEDRRMPTDLRRVTFSAHGSFHAELKHRAEEYFEGSGRSRHGGLRFGAKSGVLLAWLVASYLLLMLAPLAAWVAALLAASLGLAMAGVGFSIMHDANHGGASSSPRVNGALSLVFDLMGASSYLWRQKHNVMHHTYTNLAALDPDLEVGSPMLRLAPWQPRAWYHRYQHLYVWMLYGLLPVKWWFVSDARELVSGRICGHRIPRPRGRALVLTLAGKAIFFTWAFLLPVLVHPTWALVPLWAIATFTLGLVSGGVFQLAHCVREADFVEAAAAPGDFAEHQVATTVDFARGNPVLDFYLGGLNYQVVHHLFPRVCHLHYPALSAIVEQTCAKHGIRYRTNPGLFSALSSNVRWLRRMSEAA
jgi:linoleoyl-CoA desaturase